MKHRLPSFALALLLAAPAAAAGEIAIYRCTDASGALTVQNMPCPKGTKQEKKVMQGLPASPAATQAAKPVAAAAAPASGPATTEAGAYRILDSASPEKPSAPPSAGAANRLPPPVLFECATWDRDRYISEDGDPAPRCVPLRTVGLDGNPSTGAGEACEMKRDQCARVPDGQLCAAWKQRLGETEVAWRFGRPENAEKFRAEHERVQRIVDESNCGP